MKPQTKKTWYKQWWGIIIVIFIWPFFGIWYIWAKTNWSKVIKIATSIGVVVLFLIMLSIMGATSKPAPESNQSATQKQNDKQSSEQKSKQGLASRVEEKYLESWGISSLTKLQTLKGVPLNIRSIVGFEDYGSGNVLVRVQQDIDKEEAQYVGKQVMGTVGLDIKDVDFIVVRGTNGLDVNVSRSDIPALR